MLGILSGLPSALCLVMFYRSPDEPSRAYWLNVRIHRRITRKTAGGAALP